MKCKNCCCEFTAIEIGDIYPGCKDKEPIYCPKCNQIVSYAMTSGYFETKEIKEDLNK